MSFTKLVLAIFVAWVLIHIWPLLVMVPLTLIALIASCAGVRLQ